MQKEMMFRHRAHSPFDDSAIERLRRMGLLSEGGGPNEEAVAVLAQVYAGQFFDDLCDFCQDMAAVQNTLGRFVADAGQQDARERFLLLCLQYDAIYRPLPDPVWWLSGNLELADPFSLGFVKHLQELLEGT